MFASEPNYSTKNTLISNWRSVRRFFMRRESAHFQAEFRRCFSSHKTQIDQHTRHVTKQYKYKLGSPITDQLSQLASIFTNAGFPAHNHRHSTCVRYVHKQHNIITPSSVVDHDHHPTSSYVYTIPLKNRN